MATLTEPEIKPEKPKPVELRTGRDFGLATRALEHEAEELEKLAKKTREAGYANEARTIEADKGAITEYILPQFRAQRELPLVTRIDLSNRIGDAIEGAVHRFAVQSDNAKGKDADERWQGKREKALSARLASAVAAFATEVAEAAYAARLAARENTPEQLVNRSMSALHGGLVSLAD